jgi:hypothetical protein
MRVAPGYGNSRSSVGSFAITVVPVEPPKGDVFLKTLIPSHRPAKPRSNFFVCATLPVTHLFLLLCGQ